MTELTDKEIKLTLHIYGLKPVIVTCSSIEELRKGLLKFQEDNDMGARDMGVHHGNVHVDKRKIGYISYNGRFWKD